MIAGIAAERGVTIEIAPHLPAVHGDRTRLLQVFQNLLENAVKYMGEETQPQIEVTCRRQDGELAVCVADNGSGIDSSQQGRLFALFERIDQTVEGSGVGLALVRRIVESHGGRLWVESEGPGTGSAFYFTLPAPAAPPPPALS